MNRPDSYLPYLSAADVTLRNGGGTFHAKNLVEFRGDYGFAVGLTPGSGRIVSGEAGKAEVSAAIYNVATQFPNAPYIGTWIEQPADLVHVDPIVILPHIDDAMVLARALGQKAIWSFAAATVAGDGEILL